MFMEMWDNHGKGIFYKSLPQRVPFPKHAQSWASVVAIGRDVFASAGSVVQHYGVNSGETEPPTDLWWKVFHSLKK